MAGNPIDRGPVRRATIALAALAAAAGCGTEAAPSRDAFGERIQSIDRRGSERWAQLAQHAASLEPGARLSKAAARSIEAMVDFQRQAADELDGLAAPEGAHDEVRGLTDALRELRAIFEGALERGRFSAREFSGIERAGEAIDEAFEGLRREGFVAAEEVAGTR